MDQYENTDEFERMFTFAKEVALMKIGYMKQKSGSFQTNFTLMNATKQCVNMYNEFDQEYLKKFILA